MDVVHIECFDFSPLFMWSDKQLIQYTSCPLLALLDGCAPPPEVDLGTSSSTHVQPFSTSYASVEDEPPAELLDCSPQAERPVRSSLIRLEPLTEAEASEETLFYLCQLPETNSTQLDKVWAGALLVTVSHFSSGSNRLSSKLYWRCVFMFCHISETDAKGGKLAAFITTLAFLYVRPF